MIIQFDEKYKSFPKEEYELHVEKLQTEMKKMNLDLLLLTSPENIYYSTGYRSWYTSSLFRPVYVLVPLEGDPAVILRILEKSTVKFTSWTPNVFVSGTKARNIGYLDAESHIEATKKAIDQIAPVCQNDRYRKSRRLSVLLVSSDVGRFCAKISAI